MKYKYLTLLMLGLCSVADAQDVKPKAAEAAEKAEAKEPVKEAAAKPAVASDPIADLIKEANGLQDTFMKKVRAEKDRAKAMKLYREGRPDMAPFLKKILDLAKKDPKSASAAKGLAWGYGAFKAEDKSVAGDLLMKHHLDNDVMGNIVSGMARSRTPDIKAIQGIMMASNNEKVRQRAMATLASVYSRSGKKEDSIALYRQLTAWPNITESNSKLLDYAKQKIFVVENLAVGKVAPDIVGTDEEDKEFKLSDYRGKVVMIDFWGIW